MSDGTALASGLAPVVLPIPLLLAAAILRSVCGWPFVLGRIRIGFPSRFAVTIFAALLSNLILLYIALRRWSAPEVRNDAVGLIFLSVISQIWIAVCIRIFPWLGISLRDDAIERRNPAALTALIGALVAIGFISAGGNIGDGPSYENNFFSSGIATIAFFGCWIALELSARISTRISEERDVSAGIRVGALFVVTGLIFGRAIAGDWHSAFATVTDFMRDGAMGFVLFAAAIAIERLAQKASNALASVFIAALYVAVAAAWLIHVGVWEGYP